MTNRPSVFSMRSPSCAEAFDPADMGRMLDSLGAQRLDAGDGGCARHVAVYQDARCDQARTTGAALAVNGDALAGIQQLIDPIRRLFPSLVEGRQRHLFVSHRQVKPLAAALGAELSQLRDRTSTRLNSSH